MPVNHYFQNISPAKTLESRLLEDLIVESINISGQNCYYLPRESWDSTDNLYGEDPASKFTKAYPLVCYLLNFDSFGGDKDFFSKFGLEIRNTSNFLIARRTFNRYVPRDINRPREGDLIYVPLFAQIFEIKFADQDTEFFAVGRAGNKEPFTYELRCELFRFSNENIDTGVEDIDVISTDTSYTMAIFLTSGSGDYNVGENVFVGSTYGSANTTATVKDWNPSSKRLDLININGTYFTSNSTVRGATSNTAYSITSIDNLDSIFNVNDLFNNRQIQTEADDIIDTTEVSPFGAP